MERVEMHPDYDYDNFNNDIALIKLKKPVVFKKHINSVCLPKQDESISTKIGYVTGWGKTKFTSDKRPSILQEAKIDLISAEKCQKTFRYLSI